MYRPGFADRSKLRTWADTVASKTEFPRLVRRLILETTPGLVGLGMPAGEGVAAGSWDGTARSTAASPWVPDGLSVWELSVNSSPGVKAAEDYAKRLTTPDGSPATDCVYVEAILRPWTERASWAATRTTDGRWKAVRALGLDDIDLWLEAAPVTWAWLSEVLGLSPFGLRSAEAWWDSWSSQTSPQLNADVVLAGRDAEQGAFGGRVVTGGITTLAGASVDETCAFVAGIGVRQDRAGDGKLLSRTAFVDDLGTWRALLLEAKTPLVLVPLVDGLANEIPSGCIHHIVVPVAAASTADIELSPLDAGAVTAALAAAGMANEKQADAAGRLARRSLMALRRHIAIKPALHLPEWSAPPVSRVGRMCLLACSWSEHLDGDKRVIADLAGIDYEQVRDDLASIAQVDDPLVQRLASTWHLVSPYDAWLLLRGSLTEEDLKRFESAVRLVLGELDPGLDLAAEDRWKANLEGKTRSYSADLRRGLTRSLALLGSHGDFVVEPSGASGQSWAARLVRGLLDAANADPSGRLWSSIASELPLLAEAAPQVAIDAIRRGVTGDDPVLARLFGDSQPTGAFGSSSQHTHLLWALETLAWSSEQFGAAVDLLARLDELDPGGRLSNRPGASLAGIFCPWHPENTATVVGRLAAIDGLIDRHSDSAWNLLLSMFPERHGFHLPTSEPTYRDWKVDQSVTHVEWLSFIGEIVNRSIVLAGTNANRWEQLVARVPQLPPGDRTSVVSSLKAHAGTEDFNDATRTAVWNALRQLVGRHRGFADAEWALPAAEVNDLDTLSASFAPTDPYEVHRWLFKDYRPIVAGSVRRGDHAAHEKAIAEARRDAVQAIEADAGLPALLRLSTEATVHGTVGWALAEAVGDKYLADLVPSILSEDFGSRDLSLSYLAKRFQEAGWPWLEALLGSYPELDPEQQGRLLVLTRDYPNAWEVADGRGAAVADGFWSHFQTFGLGSDFDEVETAAERVMGVGRNAVAVQLIGLYRRHGAADSARVAVLCARALDALIHSADDSEIRALSAWDYEQAFAMLEEHRDAVGLELVGRLEWLFLPALGFEPEVPTLHALMATSPSFFAEVFSTVHGSAEPAETPPETESRQRSAQATNGYRLLSSWAAIPGLTNGAVDRTVLKTWIDDVAALLSPSDRSALGLTYLGQALVSAPPDPDGTWPPETVRDLFEELQSEAVEDGFSIEIFNRRGATSRGLEDGGVQERGLISKFQVDAAAFKDRWPRTASILRGIAESYERDAKRNEDQAERVRRGVGS